MADRPMTDTAPSQLRVLFEVRERIAYVSLNRPDKHNGLDEQLFIDLINTAKRIRKDHSLRGVILSGEGASFCAGLDFKALGKNPGMIPRLFIKWPWSSANGFQKAAYCWRTLPVPVAVAVHGNCFGGGLQIALGCDFRFATPDSKWAVMESKWGLIPDMSLTTTLTTLTRFDIAQELTMTGRIFSGEEGKEFGLVTRVSEDPMAEATALMQVIAQKSPDAMSKTKALYRKTWNAGPRCSMLWERLLQLTLLGRKNQKIAMANGLAGKDKEPKPFIDRS